MEQKPRHRVVLYALAWHLQKSDAVLEALIHPLTPWLDIELVAWDGVQSPPVPQEGEAVIFFQLPPPVFDPDWRRRSLTWVPMWDHSAAQNRNLDWWQSLPKDWRILAFSQVVAQLAGGRPGLMRRVYHRKVEADTAADQTGERVLYYWNRVGLVGPEFLEKLCDCLRVDRLLFRSELDPGIPEGRGYDLPDQLGKTVVEKVPFYDNKTDYEQQVGRATLLLAPRPLEGIGMVMLDAMARGCVVMAAPYPTATDYIRHGENGILFGRSEVQEVLDKTLSHGAWWTQGDHFLLSEKQNWEELSHLNLQKMGGRAQKEAAELAKTWQASLPELAEFLGHSTQQASASVVVKTGEEPLVSVCVPHLNSMPFTAERIASIRAQSWQNWECVVVDSGSTDGSVELWRQAAAVDTRIRVETRAREGIYPAFNEVIRLAKGAYVYIATADDTLHIRGLESMAKGLMRHPDCGLCHTPVMAIDEAGKLIKSLEYWNAGWNLLGKWAYVPHVREPPFDALCFGLYGSLYLSVTQLMYRRDALEKMAPFPLTFGSVGDFWFHLRMGAQSKVLYLPEVYGTWRCHEGQASSQTSDSGHYRMLAAMVRDAWPMVVDAHPKRLRLLPSEAAGLSYRLQAFSEAVQSEPAYLRRGFAILKALTHDPKMVRLWKYGHWHKDLAFRFKPLPLAQSFLEKCEAFELIKPA